MNESSQKKIIPGTQARAKSSITSYHITSLRVPFFEVDMGQAVYHGNYYHMFELAREDLLRKAGFPYREFMNRQLHLSVVESRCKYRKSLRYDDQIEIHTGISHDEQPKPHFFSTGLQTCRRLRQSPKRKAIPGWNYAQKLN